MTMTNQERLFVEREFDGRVIVGGVRRVGASQYLLIDPYRRDVVCQVQCADAALVEETISHSLAGFQALWALPTHERAAILRRTADAILARADELASTVSRQSGKAVTEAHVEVERAAGVFTATASALENLVDEAPLADAFPGGGDGLIAWKTREPFGVVAAITPFNAPLNLLAHKVAPAIAMGNAVIIKPPPQAPISAFQVGELMLEAGLPPAAISVLPGDAQVGALLVRHRDVAAISFTGSPQAGAHISSAAGVKPLVLELGGNSANIVHADADLVAAAKSLALGAFSNAGQSCNSVQRVLAHSSVVEELTELLVKNAAELTGGDPLDPATRVGTLIDEAAAKRVDGSVNDAVRAGAVVHLRGERNHAVLPPIVLGGVTPDMAIGREEIFGPVAVVMEYDDLDEAIQIANATEYGLQCAVFTRSLEVAVKASRELRFGGVMVNRASRMRLDHLPFGGIKQSGLRRESARDSLREFSFEKLTLIDPGMRL
jgi:acyl-CoA reductase-like NAD-dependent aldehyde dehydrogenase